MKVDPRVEACLGTSGPAGAKERHRGHQRKCDEDARDPLCCGNARAVAGPASDQDRDAYHRIDSDAEENLASGTFP
jgi:hypothetical protein